MSIEKGRFGDLLHLGRTTVWNLFIQNISASSNCNICIFAFPAKCWMSWSCYVQNV